MIKRIFITALLLAVAIIPLSVHSSASAAGGLFQNAKNSACEGVNRNIDNGECGDGGSKVAGTIRAAINVLSAVGGIIAVIMVIIGGFRYMTSNGDSNSAASARNTILFALVGLIIVAFAQVIVQFVLQRF